METTSVVAQAFKEGLSNDLAPAGYSEDELALSFTKTHGADWRYVAMRGRWFFWNGRVWRPDETLHHFDLARTICR